MPGPGLAPDTIRAICETARRLGSVSAVARELGLNWGTVKRYLAQSGVVLPSQRPVERAPAGRSSIGHKIDTIPLADEPPSAVDELGPAESSPEPEPELEPDPIELERERLNRVRKLRTERDLLKEIAGERNFRQHLESLLREVAQGFEPPPPYRAPEPRTDTSTETLFLQLSDWHAYEIVKSERVLALNRYDAEVFARRTHRIAKAAIDIKQGMERGGRWRFPKLVVACNGDFISGTIHEVERHTDALNVVHAAYNTGRTLACVLRDLSAHFEQVEVFCISGNHGRLPDARKMQQKDPTRSWDTAIYLTAITAMEERVPNIRFFVPDSYMVMYDIGPWRFLQYHGQDIRGWNSIPFYGIDRFARNINALTSGTGKPVNYYVLGHFHSFSTMPAPNGEVLENGSLIGGTEATLNRLGKCDRPVQMLLGVHDRWGVTHRWPLLADDPEDHDSYPVYHWNP